MDITDAQILADTAEPDEMINLMSQSYKVAQVPLNINLKADYFLFAWDGHSVQLNRTQAGELLSNVDSFEDELRRYYGSADETYAIIEGIISPFKLSAIRTTVQISVKPSAPPGKLYTYQISPTGFMYYEKVYDARLKMLRAWQYQLDKAGITIINTINIADTATTIVSIYESSQKKEHSTLNRYLKPKINLDPHNPQVQGLMNLSRAFNLEIGDVKAKAIMQQYGTLFNLFMAEPEEIATVEGISVAKAKQILRSIGRDL